MTSLTSTDSFADQYQPVAVYFEESDCIEYVKEDSFAVYERIDSFLTLIYDSTKIGLVGFKLKGFRYIFDAHLKPIYKLNDEQFVDLIAVLEAVCTELGDEIFTNEKVARAYKAARKLVANDNVRLNIALDAA
jgi:hypothetical protein